MKKEALNCFRELVQKGEIKSFLSAHHTFNIYFPTFGGNVFWCNLAEIKGWRIQQNEVFGNCRILDPNDCRIAWGSEAQIEELLMDRPNSFLSNYWEDGYKFACYKSERNTQDALIIIHGLLHRGFAMSETAKTFAEKGYDVYVYDYPTSEDDLKDHAQRFLKEYRLLFSKIPSHYKIQFLTHSMGGVLLRLALTFMNDNEADLIHRIVMFAPPNKGSDWAFALDLFSPFIVPFNKAICDLSSSADSAVNKIPTLKYNIPIGIIIAERDIKVSKTNTRLEHINCQYATIDCHHSEIRYLPEMIHLSHNFFTSGKFY